MHMSSHNAQATVEGARGPRLDLFAMGLSTLCLIHCLAIPLLASALPFMAHFAENELAHRLLVLAAAPVSLAVVWTARSVAGSGLFIAAALTGLALLFTGAFVGAVSAYEESITVVGAVLLGSAHLWRWLRLRKRRE